MFHGGYLTYEGADSLFRNWRPESDILYEILFGALVTVFTYQLTKLILEVGLGQTRRGEIQAYDLYIYMIVSGLSLFSVISSFRSKGTYRREESEGYGCFHSASQCSKSGRRIWVLGKYLVLLIFVLCIHIVGIFLSVEKETDLSFRDLNFGGLAMGLQESASAIRMKSPSNDCQQVQTRLGQGDSERTAFFRCKSGPGAFIPFDNQDNIDTGNFIVILRSSATDIGVTVVTLGKRWMAFLHLDMHDGKQPYFLKNALTLEQSSQIFERGVRRMVAKCESAVQTRDINTSWVISTVPSQEINSVLVECAGFDEDVLIEIAEEMLTNVTFVETELFAVSDRPFGRTSDEMISADDIVFVQRHGSSVSLLVMVLMTLGVVTVRLAVQLFLRSEGSFALDVILKDEFGLSCCDSMLQYEQTVSYDRHGTKNLMEKRISCDTHCQNYSEESSATSSDLNSFS